MKIRFEDFYTPPLVAFVKQHGHDMLALLKQTDADKFGDVYDVGLVSKIDTGVLFSAAVNNTPLLLMARTELLAVISLLLSRDVATTTPIADHDNDPISDEDWANTLQASRSLN